MITIGTSGVVAVVPDVSSSSIGAGDFISTLVDLPGGCEVRPCVADGGRAGKMLVGASLNGGLIEIARHTQRAFVTLTPQATPLQQQLQRFICVYSLQLLRGRD